MLRPVVFQFGRIVENCLSAGTPSLTFVRWRRKPRWFPVAKSKMFRVPERRPQDPDERLELLRLHNNYRTQMRSVKGYLREEAQRIQHTSTADHLILTPEQEEAEFQKCLAENEAWNAANAKIRAERLQKEAEQRKVYVAEKLEAAKLRSEERLEKIEEIVRLEKERSKTFITKETLDAAIEHALANPVDHNFSIDLAGNMYKGRETVPDGGGSNKESAVLAALTSG